VTLGVPFQGHCRSQGHRCSRPLRKKRRIAPSLRRCVSPGSHSPRSAALLARLTASLLAACSAPQAPKPSPGPHKERECLPLAIILRNRLKYALTYRESNAIVMQRLIEVDGKVRTDKCFPAGFMGESHAREGPLVAWSAQGPRTRLRPGHAGLLADSWPRLRKIGSSTKEGLESGCQAYPREAPRQAGGISGRWTQGEWVAGPPLQVV